MPDMKHLVQKAFGHFGYRLSRTESVLRRPGRENDRGESVAPHSIDPVWPLPRGNKDLSAGQIRERFASYGAWHYAYEFEGGLRFPAHTNQPGPLTDDSNRPLQRFRHFMPYLIAAQGGSLRGKRVLDIACNSGFWSIQCAILGAEVLAFDARPELIEQANLLKSIVGLNNLTFRLLDFWDMSPESLGGKFDVVLSLGILYHLAKPLDALQLTTAMARENVLLDTEVYPSNAPSIMVRWEEPTSIRSANRSGIVALPSKSCIDLILRDIGVSEWFEVPLRLPDMPLDYIDHRRASWLIKI
jgi:2-polyprenyl-3-methyl-5-hydroxy-6-metoxy-1,4-benzoquinol methylase